MTKPTIITIIVDDNIDQELEQQADATGHSKPDVIRDVLEEWLQDEPTSSSTEVRQRLGLER